MLPGFQLILGLGALFYSDASERAKAYNNPDKATPEQLEIFDHYLNWKAATEIYAPEEWPKYIYTSEYARTTWKELACFYGTSVHILQEGYFCWKCKQEGIPFEYDIFLRAYHRSFYRETPDNQIQPQRAPNLELDARIRELKGLPPREVEKKLNLTEAERKAYDDELRKKRAAVRAERLAREAEERRRSERK